MSESLWYELGAFGIKVKVIEPGAVSTNFSGRSMDVPDTSRFPDYATVMDKLTLDALDSSKIRVKRDYKELLENTLRIAATTFQLFSWKNRAVALPMPLEAPVITIVFVISPFPTACRRIPVRWLSAWRATLSENQ